LKFPTRIMYVFAVPFMHVKYFADVIVLDLINKKKMHFQACSNNFRMPLNEVSGRNVCLLSDNSLNAFRRERTREWLIIMQFNEPLQYAVFTKLALWNMPTAYKNRKLPRCHLHFCATVFLEVITKFLAILIIRLAVHWTVQAFTNGLWQIIFERMP
jgi:hypothetical protein